MMTRVHVLGAGTPFPHPDRFGSSYVIEVGDERVLFDCGPATTHKLAKAGMLPTDIDALFFTHHHFDHDADYPCFLLSRWERTVDEADLVVRGPTVTSRLTEDLMGEHGAFAHDWKARMGWPNSRQAWIARGGVEPRRPPTYDVADIGVGHVHETDGWRVRATHAQHVQPFLDSLAYRLECPTGDVVVTGDTEPCESVVELSRGASAMIAECWDHQERMDAKGPPPGQLGTIGAAVMAQRAEVATLVLVHRSPALAGPDDEARAREDIARVYDGRVVWADELDVVDVGRDAGAAAF